MWKLTLKRLYRNPKYPLALAIGIILSVSIIIGVNMTVDHMTGIVLQSKLEETPVDFVASKTLYDITELSNITSLEYKIEEISGVRDAEFTWNLRLFSQYFNTTPTNYTVSKLREMFNSQESAIKRRHLNPTIIGIPPTFGFDGNGIFWVDGGLDTSDNFSIGVPVEFAEAYNLTVGDTFYFASITYNLSEIDPNTNEPVAMVNNIKLKVSGVYQFTGAFEKIFSLNPVVNPFGSVYFLGTFSSAYEVFQNATFGQVARPQNNFKIYIFIDRETTISPYNIESTTRRLNQINTELSILLQPRGFIVEDLISEKMNELNSWLLQARVEFGLFSLPVIIVGLFLTTTIAYVVLELKRREIGLLKVRGTTDSQVIKILALEIISIGFIAAIVWPVVSSLFTFYLMTRFEALWGLTPSETTNFIDVGSYLYLGVILAFIFAAVAAAIPYKLVANMKPIEAIGRTIERDETKSWKPKWVILGLILGGYKIIAWLVGFNPSDLIDLLNPSSFLLAIALAIFVFVDFVLQYIGPIVFVYSATKILMMRMPKITERLEPLMMKVSGSLGKLSLSSIIRKTSRYARVGFIISLAISFGITFAVNQAIIYNYQVQTIKVTNGADINLQTHLSDLDVMENLTKLSGVTGVTYIFEASITFGLKPATIIAIDPLSYLNVSSDYLSDDLSINGLCNSLLKLDSNTEYALVSKSFLSDTDFKIGDTLNLLINKNATDSTTLNLQIIDSAYTLPGVHQVFHFSPLVIVVNINLLNTTGILSAYTESYKGFYSSFLVDVANNANTTAIVEKIENIRMFSSVSVTEKQIEALRNDPYYASIIEFLNIEYILMTLVATLVLGFIMYLSITERRKEFGVMIARGASTLQIIRLLLTESLVVIIIALVLGVITGLASGYGLALFSITMYNQLIPIKMIIPPSVYLLIVTSAVIFLLSVILPGYLAGKTNLREVLRDL